MIHLAMQLLKVLVLTSLCHRPQAFIGYFGQISVSRVPKTNDAMFLVKSGPKRNGLVPLRAEFELGGTEGEAEERQVRLRASHILVDSEAFADTILEQLEGGVEFGSLAQASQCPSKEKDGDIGWFGLNEMMKPFEEKCLGMEEGQISKVQTELGWHVVRLTGKKYRDIDPTFEERVINKASHILVDSEEEARALLAKLTKGETPFAELAEKHSKCPSAKRGGSLGWVVPGSAPPEIFQALMRCEVENQLSVESSSFGWHVLWYQGRRNKPLILDAQQMAAVLQNVDLKKQFNIIDVREADASKNAPLPDCSSINLPLSQCNDWAKKIAEQTPEEPFVNTEKPTLCICEEGKNSAAVASFLALELGFTQTFSVEGGLKQYAKEIDPRILL